MPPGAGGHYFEARLDGRVVAAIGSQPEADGRTVRANVPLPRSPALWQTYIAVDDADATAARVTEAGGTVTTAPFDIFDVGRTAACVDPAGATFHLWQAGRRRGAAVVNEPGSWNWSNLHTDDPDRAAAFYGTVFGWEADPFPVGGADGLLLHLDGYADFLAERDPEIRRRHAELGAPKMFSDAVGWLVPLAGAAPAGGAGPHWAVTLTVDDADATAKHTAELGGEVLVAPFDAGPVRLAVVRDPQGAVFSVNHFTPG